MNSNKLLDYSKRIRSNSILLYKHAQEEKMNKSLMKELVEDNKIFTSLFLAELESIEE